MFSGWTTSEIRDALPHGAISRIARRLGKHQTAVTHVVHGRIRSRRIEGAIAQALGVKRDAIFPVRKESATEPEEAA